MLRKIVFPILFVLFAFTFLSAPSKSAQAQVAEDPFPGTIVPVVKLKVDISVPERPVSGEEYEINVVISNTGEVTASVSLTADFISTQFTGVEATTMLTRTAIVSHPYFDSKLFTHLEQPLEPGQAVTVTLKGWQFSTGPVEGDIVVDGVGLNPDVVNARVSSFLQWIVGWPTNLAIDGSLDKNALSVGEEVLLTVNITSTGKITDTLSVVKLTGFGLVSIDGVLISPVITGTRSASNNGYSWRFATAGDAAEIKAASMSVDCPGNPDCVVAEGDLLIFWKPNSEKDFVQINIVLAVESALKYSIFGAINPASYNIFTEGPVGDNTFRITPNVNHSVYLPLVVR